MANSETNTAEAQTGEKLVWVTLKHSVGPRGGRLYGPGTVQVPQSVAETCGWPEVDAPAGREDASGSSSGGSGGSGQEDDPFADYAGVYGDGSGNGEPTDGFPNTDEELSELTVSQLEDEATVRNIAIKDGSGSGGRVVKADLIAALKR